MRRLIFIILVALSFDSANADISIAILDTGFCPKERQFNNIIIKSPIDLTKTNVQLNCENDYLKQPRFHGENVLKVLTADYQGKQKIIVQPFIIYDRRGETDKKYWITAMERFKKVHFDYVISAVGIKNDDLKLMNDKSKWFLSAPRVSPFIKNNDSIFPQNQFQHKNVFLVGNYTPPNFIDQGLLYKDKIKYLVVDSKSEFNGSSYAVAFLAAKFLSRCQNINESNQCIKFLNSFNILSN